MYLSEVQFFYTDLTLFAKKVQKWGTFQTTQREKKKISPPGFELVTSDLGILGSVMYILSVRWVLVGVINPCVNSLWKRMIAYIILQSSATLRIADTSLSLSLSGQNACSEIFS